MKSEEILEIGVTSTLVSHDGTEEFFRKEDALKAQQRTAEAFAEWFDRKGWTMVGGKLIDGTGISITISELYKIWDNEKD